MWGRGDREATVRRQGGWASLGRGRGGLPVSLVAAQREPVPGERGRRQLQRRSGRGEVSCLFLMTLPVFRAPGEVFCRMSISLGVFDVFFS